MMINARGMLNSAGSRARQPASSLLGQTEELRGGLGPLSQLSSDEAEL
eukprot:COSAG01_NODE_1483_length_10158_cov_38.218290_9_plen_48_part_00